MFFIIWPLKTLTLKSAIANQTLRFIDSNTKRGKNLEKLLLKKRLKCFPVNFVKFLSRSRTMLNNDLKQVVAML